MVMNRKRYNLKKLYLSGQLAGQTVYESSLVPGEIGKDYPDDANQGLYRVLDCQLAEQPAGSIKTVWVGRTYDVWGNARDGYEVNDTYSMPTEQVDLAGRSLHGILIYCPVTRHNCGTPQEFKSATPSDRAIKRAFGVSCRIATDGDDTHITVDRERDSYPIGELTCVSHESLSPIRGRV